MSRYANTVLPTVEAVFEDREPPTDAAVAATMIAMAGYPDVAQIVKGMSHDSYERMVWDAHLRAVEDERPLAFADETNEEDLYEERFNNK